jgi:hypothetical protein
MNAKYESSLSNASANRVELSDTDLALIAAGRVGGVGGVGGLGGIARIGSIGGIAGVRLPSFGRLFSGLKGGKGRRS